MFWVCCAVPISFVLFVIDALGTAAANLISPPWDNKAELWTLKEKFCRNISRAAVYNNSADLSEAVKDYHPVGRTLEHTAEAQSVLIMCTAVIM